MENVKLKNIANITAGNAAPKNFSNHGVPFIRAGHLESLLNGSTLSEIQKVSKEEAKKMHLKIAPSGTIFFAKSGMSANKNRVYVSNENSYFVSHLAAIFPSSKYNTNYLARYLSWYKPSNLVLDSSYPSIRLEDINNIEIPLPNLATQKKIAARLDKADEIRQYNKQLIEKYDQLTKSLFLDMFGDPVKNEKGWGSSTVIDVCKKILGGGTPSKSNPSYYVGNIPWVTPKDMKYEYIVDSIDHINLDAIENSSVKLVHKECVLMVIRSGILKHTLPVAINKVDLAINQDMKAFVPNSKKTNAIYLKAFFDSVASYLLSKVRAVTADNIEFSQIKNLNFPLPPITLQNEFANRVEIIEAQKQQVQDTLAKSEALFQRLLQDSFN